MKSKALLLLFAALLLAALMEPSSASGINLPVQDDGSNLFSNSLIDVARNGNGLLTDTIAHNRDSNNAANADWTPESWLCSLNNELCRGQITDPKTNENRKVEGGIFTVIDDALENHAADVKIRMFEYRIAKNGDNSELVAQEVKRLNEELSSTQTTREILGKQLKEGTITDEEYAAALRKTEREENSNKKQAREMAEVVRNNLNDDKLSTEFDKISKAKEDGNGRNGRNEEKETGSGTKGKENVVESSGNRGSSGGGSSAESGGKGKSDSDKSSSDKGSSGKGSSSGGGGNGGGSSSGGSGGGSSGGGSSGGSGGGSGGGSSGGGGSGGGNGGGSGGGSSGGGGGSGGGGNSGGNS